MQSSELKDIKTVIAPKTLKSNMEIRVDSNYTPVEIEEHRMPVGI